MLRIFFDAVNPLHMIVDDSVTPNEYTLLRVTPFNYLSFKGGVLDEKNARKLLEILQERLGAA